MAWITPKTDWMWGGDGDYFTHHDYNRIKGNIEYLHEVTEEVYQPYKIKPMGSDKTYNDYPYAYEFNLFASNLQTIVDNTYPIDIGEAITYEDNGLFIGFDDLNRIERACLLIYEGLDEQVKRRLRLATRLGAWRLRI